jgi:hypothetical protein
MTRRRKRLVVARMSMVMDMWEGFNGTDNCGLTKNRGSERTILNEVCSSLDQAQEVPVRLQGERKGPLTL